MSTVKLLHITEFSNIAQVSRSTLLYYDKIQLLSPVLRKNNNYRMYSHTQLATVNLIRIYQSLGMDLDEIKSLVAIREPDATCKIFKDQIEKFSRKIGAYSRAIKIFQHLIDTIQSARNIDTSHIVIQYAPTESIVLGGQNDYSYGQTDYDAFLSFYRDCFEQYGNVDMNYSAWAMYAEDKVKQQDLGWPDRFYYKNPEGKDKKPAALYATGYKYGRYGQGRDLLEPILKYIEANNFEVCGPAYEEYPLNEVCVEDENNYLIRMMITVRPA
jgi:DNA-binding transcriptional MerR regulator